MGPCDRSTASEQMKKFKGGIKKNRQRRSTKMEAEAWRVSPSRFRCCGSTRQLAITSFTQVFMTNAHKILWPTKTEQHSGPFSRRRCVQIWRGAPLHPLPDCSAPCTLLSSVHKLRPAVSYRASPSCSPARRRLRHLLTCSCISRQQTASLGVWIFIDLS